MSSNDQRNRLIRQFDIQNRFQVFGDSIRKITLEGFRCHGRTIIDVKSPIMAFSGLNGTGKSTILQVIAAAYRNPRGKTYSINEFFTQNDLDQEPISSDARAIFEFEISSRSTRPLTLSKPGNQARRREWNGQRRRQTRHVYYAGVSEYIPKVEKPYYCYRARGIRVGNPEAVSDRAKQWVSQILQKDYHAINRYEVNVGGDRNPFITHVTKKFYEGDGEARIEKEVAYSEANMGFGEARTIHMVTTIESLPDKSLILLEEPETSLHPSAQYQFGRYLVDVALLKKHQIFITTHSEHLQQSLPSASNCFLNKIEEKVIRPVYNIQPSQSRSLLTEGNVKAITVLVEDECARSILREIIRTEDEVFLRTIEISVGGSCDRIRESVKGFQLAKLNIACVLDADQGTNANENIFKLPGTLPPEKEIMQCTVFEQFLFERYNFRLQDFRTQLIGIEHHSWLGRLATQLSIDEDAIRAEGARCHVSVMTSAERASLVEQLKNALKF